MAARPSGSARLDPLTGSGARDPVQHSLEHEPVQRPDRVPVGEPPEPERLVGGGLVDRRAPALDGLDLELQPGAAGHAHLGGEPEEAVGLVRLDPPEVDRVADAKRLRVTAPAAQPRTADEHVQEAPELPEPAAVVPARRAADPPNWSECGRGRLRDPPGPRVDE